MCRVRIWTAYIALPVFTDRTIDREAVLDAAHDAEQSMSAAQRARRATAHAAALETTDEKLEQSSKSKFARVCVMVAPRLERARIGWGCKFARARARS